MNRSELSAAIAENVGITGKEGKKAMDAIFSVMREELSSGGEVRIIGFGTFKRVDRGARTIKSPRDGKLVNVPASKSVKLVVGKELKEAVNKG